MRLLSVLCVLGFAHVAIAASTPRMFVTKDAQGQTLRLTVREHKASGYFGTVYRATDAEGRSHAVKFLKPKWLGTWNRKTADFTGESEVLRAIHGVNTHLVGGFGEGYLEGGRGPRVTGVHIDWAGDGMHSLGSKLSEPLRQRAPGKAVRIVREVLSGLVALHRAGYAHEDVGPGNVMIHESDSTASVKVIDPANGRNFSPNNPKQRLDVQRAAQLLVALLEGRTMDTKLVQCPQFAALKSDGIAAAELARFRVGLRPILQRALDGNLDASELHEALWPFAQHSIFR